MNRNIKFYLVLIPILSLFLNTESQAQFLNYKINTGNSHAAIPFQLHNDFIVIPVKLGGMLPLRFILDTGASNTIVIHKEITDFLGTKYERELYVQGVDRSKLIKVLLTEGVKIEFKDITATSQHLLVLDETHIEFEKYSGSRIDGILGMDIFKRFIIKIDYESKMLYLFEPKKHNYNTTKYSTIPFIQHREKMYLHTSTSIAQDDPKDVSWLIDSGAAMTVLFQCQESDTTLLPQNRIPGNIGKGLGGYIEGYLGTVNQVNFGNYSFENVVGNFQTIPDSLFSPENVDVLQGILGNKILQQFHLIFDYHNKVLFARPNKYYNSRIQGDLSGLGMIASGYNLNQFIVEEVYPNSPAAHAGLLKGDFIKKINGRSTLLMSLYGVEKKLSAGEGKKIKLVVKRGNEKIKIGFYLKDYLNTRSK